MHAHEHCARLVPESMDTGYVGRLPWNCGDGTVRLSCGGDRGAQGGCFYMVLAALPHLRSGSAIINVRSITGLEGNKQLLDYSATKGSINAVSRCLDRQAPSQSRPSRLDLIQEGNIGLWAQTATRLTAAGLETALFAAVLGVVDYLWGSAASHDWPALRHTVRHLRWLRC